MRFTPRFRCVPLNVAATRRLHAFSGRDGRWRAHVVNCRLQLFLTTGSLDIWFTLIIYNYLIPPFVTAFRMRCGIVR